MCTSTHHRGQQRELPAVPRKNHRGWLLRCFLGREQRGRHEQQRLVLRHGDGSRDEHHGREQRDDLRGRYQRHDRRRPPARRRRPPAWSCGAVLKLYPETAAGVYCPFSAVDGGKNNTCAAHDNCCEPFESDAGVSPPSTCSAAACPKASTPWRASRPLIARATRAAPSAAVQAPRAASGVRLQHGVRVQGHDVRVVVHDVDGLRAEQRLSRERSDVHAHEGVRQRLRRLRRRRDLIACGRYDVARASIHSPIDVASSFQSGSLSSPWSAPLRSSQVRIGWSFRRGRRTFAHRPASRWGRARRTRLVEGRRSSLSRVPARLSAPASPR